MFPLRDRTRRCICRTMFLAVGVAPTLSLIGWCLAMTSPSHIASLRDQFAAAIGVNVQFEKLTHPRPGATLLEGLELSDRETNKSLARIGQLEMRADDHPTCIISAAEINAAQIDWLWRLIERRLQLGADRHDGSLRVILADVSVRWPGGSQSFVDSEFYFSDHDTVRSLAATTRPVNTSATTPIEIRVDRSIDASGVPSTTVELRSVDTPLPCGLLTTLAKLENQLGAQCTWQGTMNLAGKANGWRGKFQGHLHEVDLHAAVSNQFSQQIDGRAEIDIHHMVVQNGCLESSEGSVRAREGSVSGSFLTAAERLELKGATFSGPREQLFTFSEMHFDYSIDAIGIGITGECGQANSGIIIRSQNGAMLVNSGRAKVPTAALVNLLIPDHQITVPAIRQANRLLQMLPMMGER